MTAPVRILDRAPNLRRHDHRAECWAAETVDGVWGFVRVEDDSTSWTIHHRPSGRTLDFEASLPVARAHVASGGALAEIRRATADQARPRCTWVSPWGTGSCCSDFAVPGTARCGNPIHAQENR